jgi:hypothetical protein
VKLEARPLPTATILEIPSERDPRLAAGRNTRLDRLARLSPAQRAALVLERYPELDGLPNCDWHQLSARACFSILFGESSRHFAHVELALLAGVLASAGVAPGYAFDVDSCVRSVLDLLQQRFGITTAQAITRGRCGKPGAATRTTCARLSRACGSTPPR